MSNQARSRESYSVLLEARPRLDMPGMTEFALGSGAVLGLIPESGIRRLPGDALPDPALARGVPRAGLYLVVDSPATAHARALAAGARELSPPLPRDRGAVLSYCLDPDGHVVAMAGRE